jgi:hypothetical protein
VSPVETLWSVALLAATLVALLVFRRKRRATVDYAESKAVKERLPAWVKTVELLMLAVFLALLLIIAFALLDRLEAIFHASIGLAGASAIYTIFGLAFIVLPLGLLCTNALSWLVPFLRDANQRAFQGTHVSFATANRGLLKLACVSTPLGILVIAIAAFAPWNR